MYRECELHVSNALCCCIGYGPHWKAQAEGKCSACIHWFILHTLGVTSLLYASRGCGEVCVTTTNCVVRAYCPSSIHFTCVGLCCSGYNNECLHLSYLRIQHTKCTHLHDIVYSAHMACVTHTHTLCTYMHLHTCTHIHTTYSHTTCMQVALLCGPPGLGKTTLAHIIAKQAGYNVIEMNARYTTSALQDWP